MFKLAHVFSRCCYEDIAGRRKTSKGWEDVWIEFEYKSSHFKVHKHDPKECDIIVCWEHDRKDCPLEVIELRKVISEFTAKSHLLRFDC